MSDEHLLTRRRFTVDSALAMLAGVAITVTGCGDDDPPGSPSPPAGSKTGSVSVDAGHSHGGATITAAQLSAGNAITLTLTGGGHTHTVALTQAELANIDAGVRVSKTSSNDDAHTHVVTFN